MAKDSRDPFGSAEWDPFGSGEWDPFGSGEWDPFGSGEWDPFGSGEWGPKGPFNLVTQLHIFVPLFNKVRKIVQVDEISTPTVPTMFKEVASIPIFSDQELFVMDAENSELSSTQDCILECIRLVVQKQLDTQSRLRAAILDILRLLLEFVQYTIGTPAAKFASN
uniref:Mon2 C-terminal domain-containing protein n=1 Tax=Ditylenchus dipsaci TaxID=166011 RepID=A0A915EPR0_9BILA